MFKTNSNYLRKASAFLVIILLLSSTDAFSQGPEKIKLVNSGEVINEGIKLHDEGKYNEAVNKYLEVSRNDTNYALAVYEMAFSLTEQEEYKKAIPLCQAGLKLNSEYQQRFYDMLGTAYDYAGEYQKSIDTYQEAMKKFPLSNKLHHELGVVYMRNKKDKEAMMEFQKSLDMNFLYAGSHLQLGMLCARNNYMVHAILSLQTFLLLEPASKRSFNVVQVLESLARGEFEVKKDSIRDLGLKEDFSELETILKSQVALDPKYKSIAKTRFNFVKQIQAMFEKMTYDPNVDGYWMKHYVSYYTELWQKKMFEPFAYFMLASINDDETQATINKSKSKIEKFVEWGITTLVDKRKKRTWMWEGKEQPVEFYFYKSGDLQAIGKTDEKTKNNIGYFEFYYENGFLQKKGHFDEAGKKTGEWTYYRENGTMSFVEMLKADNNEGPYTSYYENGGKKEIGAYADNKADGRIVSHSATGAKTFEGDFKNDVREGKVITYYNNGQKASESNYKNNELDGEYKGYHQNGQLKLQYNSVNGKANGELKRYYENGQLENKGNYVEDEMDGEWVWYHENGKMQKQGKYLKGKETGKWVSYYENGQIETENNYENGLLNGTEKTYDEDGKLWNEFEYSKGKIKKYSYYDKSGKVLHSATGNGSSIKFISYDALGFKNQEGTFRDGVRDGNWKVFNAAGVVIRENFYKKGRKDGTEKVYYANGAIHEEIPYAEGSREGYYREYFRNGAVATEGWFVNDDWEGYWNYYYINGALKTVTYFLRGEKVGYEEHYEPDNFKYEEWHRWLGYWENYAAFDSTGKERERVEFPMGKGKALIHYENGKVKMEGNYLHGVREGEFKYYHNNGKLSYQETYVAGQTEGWVRSFHVNGKLKSEGKEIHGDHDSLWTDYFDDGKVLSKAYYKKGLNEGNYTWYYQNGKTELTGNFKADQRHGEFTYYAEDGAVRVRITYVHGIPVSYTYIGKDNKMLPEIALPNGSGKVIAYYPNGNKSVEFEFLNGVRNGSMKYYHPNGNLEFEYYYENGIQEREEKGYYANGKLKYEEKLKGDYTDGPAKYYYESGKLKKETSYLLGSEHGIRKEYDETGKITKTTVFRYGEPQN